MSSNDRPQAARFGALGFMAVALGCAGFAAFMVARMMHQRGYSNERVRPVVVAKRSLPAAMPLTEDALEVVNWPESTVPAGAFEDPKALFAGGKAPVPTAGILAGEPILPARLAGSAQGTGLAALVRPGFRAVVVKVDDSVGRAGLVYPGAMVDVLATIRDPEGRGPSTRVAVENCRVLALEADTDSATRKIRKNGDSIASSSPDGTVVTLEVSPDDAEIVSLAVREGKVDLALRNASDEKPGETHGATPIQFSAFAPNPALAQGTPGTQTAGNGMPMTTPASTAAANAPSKTSTRALAASGIPTAGTNHRHIEIKAYDGPDGAIPTNAPAAAATSGQIETYHAH